MALAAFAAWAAVLAWLALTTANPVSVNVAQVREAAAIGMVVEVTVLDPASQRCRVERILASSARLLDAVAKGDEITVSGLEQAGAISGHVYVAPLVRHDGKFQVLSTELGNRLPLIYPAEPATQAQIDDLFQGQRRT